MKDRQDLDKNYIGTCFDRQVRIQQWDQKKISQQYVLILGVGGLGSILLINLLRLGVRKIHIVDYDVVQLHNLNRQLMYTKDDVGKRKVDCAIKNSLTHNLNNTQINGFHGSAVKHWDQIIKMALEANVVFNCIDYGEYFDIAVTALCLKLKIPLIMGGTYATSLTVDYFSNEAVPCYLCSDDFASNKQIINQITPEKILSLTDLSFLPKNNNPISQSSPIVCTICGQFMVSHYLNFLCLSQTKPYPSSRLIFYHNTFQIMKFDIQANKKCIFCGDPNYVEPQKLKQPQIQKTEQMEEVIKSQQIKKQPIIENKNQQINEEETKMNKKVVQQSLKKE